MGEHWVSQKRTSWLDCKLGPLDIVYKASTCPLKQTGSGLRGNTHSGTELEHDVENFMHMGVTAYSTENENLDDGKRKDMVKTNDVEQDGGTNLYDTAATFRK